MADRMIYAARVLMILLSLGVLPTILCTYGSSPGRRRGTNKSNGCVPSFSSARYRRETNNRATALISSRERAYHELAPAHSLHRQKAFHGSFRCASWAVHINRGTNAEVALCFTQPKLQCETGTQQTTALHRQLVSPCDCRLPGDGLARRDAQALRRSADAGGLNNDEATVCVQSDASGSPPIVLMLGPPCSGKGSVAQQLQQEIPVRHVSVGDELRSFLKNLQHRENVNGALSRNPTIANGAVNCMKSGALVDSAVVASVLRHRLHSLSLASEYSSTRAILLDGFPRSAEQVAIMSDVCTWPALTIQLVVSDADVLERFKSRLVDPETGRIYGRGLAPPPTLVHSGSGARDDDTDTTIRRRLSDYRRREAGILRRLERRNRSCITGGIIKIDGGKDLRDVVADVKAVLRKNLRLKSPCCDAGQQSEPLHVAENSG